MTDLPKPSGPEPEQPEPKHGSGSSEANQGQTIEPVALLHLWQIQPIRDLLWLALIVIAIWRMIFCSLAEGSDVFYAEVSLS